MKNIYYAIALNMISITVIAQTPVQPVERLQTPPPMTGTEYGKENKELTDEGLRKPENVPAENSAQAPTENLSVPRLVEENRPVLARKSPVKATKFTRTAPTRRPLSISFSIGALMLSVNR